MSNTHFLSSDEYSEGYQLKTSLNSPSKEGLRASWGFLASGDASSTADIFSQYDLQ